MGQKMWESDFVAHNSLKKTAQRHLKISWMGDLFASNFSTFGLPEICYNSCVSTI